MDACLAGYLPRGLLRPGGMHLAAFDRLRLLTIEIGPSVPLDGTLFASRVNPVYALKIQGVLVKFFVLRWPYTLE